MTSVVFVFPDERGDQQEESTADDPTLMHLATRLGMPGIVGECGGEMSCATCHLYLRTGDVLPPSHDEEDMLELVDDRRSESRLSCQLPLGAPGELVVELPA